jgi:hypothetical protein
MEAVFMDRNEFREFALKEAEFFGREIPKLLTLDR